MCLELLLPTRARESRDLSEVNKTSRDCDSPLPHSLFTVQSTHVAFASSFNNKPQQKTPIPQLSIVHLPVQTLQTLDIFVINNLIQDQPRNPIIKMSSSISGTSAATSVETSQPKQLLDFPTELHLKIVARLDLPEKMNLRGLCRHYPSI